MVINSKVVDNIYTNLDVSEEEVRVNTSANWNRNLHRNYCLYCI